MANNGHQPTVCDCSQLALSLDRVHQLLDFADVVTDDHEVPLSETPQDARHLAFQTDATRFDVHVTVSETAQGLQVPVPFRVLGPGRISRTHEDVHIAQRHAMLGQQRQRRLAEKLGTVV